MPRSATTPAPIITAAVLLFVYGGLLLLCGICGGATGAFAIANKGKDPQQAKLDAIMEKEAPGSQIVGFANVFANLLVALMMIGAGIGVLQCSQIARYVAYLAVTMELLGACCVKIWQITFILPATEKVMAAAMAQQGAQRPPFDMGAMMTGFGAVLHIGIMMVQLGFLIPIAICLSTARARAAFAGKLPERRDDRDDERRDDDGYDDGYGRSPKNPGDTGIQQ